MALEGDLAITNQLGCLYHRGPDATGYHEDGSTAIGQTRLAVIDLATGDPPIFNEDRRIVVSFNGEIYNFRQLRRQLQAAGHEFKTDGDTEVIAHLAEDLPMPDVCRLLDGMYAFAVWDVRAKSLVLARDRLGKKPLYFWRSPSGDVVFGSEIKAVLADPRVPRRLATRSVDAYLTFGYVPTPETFFDGIKSVPPAHVMTFRHQEAPTIEAHWTPRSMGRTTIGDLSLRDAGREVRNRLTDAVEKRMVADVPVGAFLSGGIDSSAVVALMARLNFGRIRTFTIGFDDAEGFDERPYAREISRLYGTEHTEFVVSPDKAELIERLVWHHDQPFGDSSALPVYLLAELTRRHVTVALCGDGGDELFAGYERLAASAALEHLGFVPRRLWNRIGRSLDSVPPDLVRGRVASARRMVGRASDGVPDALLSWVSYVQPEWRRRLLPSASDWAQEEFHRLWGETEGRDVVTRLLDLNLRTYLLDDLLPKMDRMSMANGLEVRSPFLDDDLLDFSFRLPGSYKVRAWSMKRVLKEAVREIVPRQILHRRKRGFGIPLDRWFRTDLRGYLESMLLGSGARLGELLARDAINSMVGDHMEGGASHGHALWTLLTLEVFLRQQGW